MQKWNKLDVVAELERGRHILTRMEAAAHHDFLEQGASKLIEQIDGRGKIVLERKTILCVNLK